MSQPRKRRRVTEGFKEEVEDMLKEMVAEAIPTIASKVVAQLQELNNPSNSLSQSASSSEQRCAAASVQQPLPGNDTANKSQQTSTGSVDQTSHSMPETPSQLIPATSSAQQLLPGDNVNQQTSDSVNPVLQSSKDFGVSQTSTIYGSPVDTCTRRDVQALKSLSIYLAENALTVSTRNSYNRAKLTCNEFLSKYFPGAPMFPMTNEQLVLFISYCYQKELSPQTVTTYMSALAHFHKMEGYPDPTQNFIVKRTIQGFSKLKARPDTRLPITPVILQRIINSLPKCTQSFYQRTLFKAMFLLAFHAFLRVGEITSPTKNTLNLSAVSFEKQQNGVPECMTLTMVDFKHHRGKPPVTFHLNANKDKPELCAVLAMWEYKELRGGGDGPLFMFQDKSPVSRHYFNQQLKISLNYLNYDTKLYKGHSFRIGAATLAKSKGISDEQIQLLGRWKSNAYKKYIRIPLLNI